ncbi:hypothetical protein [Formosa sp. S-31]|uniref:hypothetical protein n=1 Tax=Formosa sp. S-31 TaxID=2790949 RepID=UPI003EC022E7
MKEKLHINKIYGSLFTCSLIVLIVLLLLSPCKIRHFIQEELGLTKTEVLNKSKSTYSTSSCLSFENTKALPVLDILTGEPAHFPGSLYNYTSQVLLLVGAPEITQPTPQKKNVPIPLYILYLNLKIYS